MSNISTIREHKGMLLKILFKQIDHLQSVEPENKHKLRMEFNRTTILCNLASKIIHADTVDDFPFFDGDLSSLSGKLWDTFEYISDFDLYLNDNFELKKAKMIGDCADAIIKIADIEEHLLYCLQHENDEEDANSRFHKGKE